MLKKLMLIALSALSAAGVRAEEEAVFISLTRTEEKRNSLPANISVLTRQEIQDSGAITLDQALERLPAVTLNRTGTLGAQTTVRLRGVPDFNQVQIVVDDQPLGGVGIQDVDLSQIPLSNVERIEVVRGGASALYGANAIGGIIHIITRRHKDAKPMTRVTYQAKSHATRNQGAEFGMRSGRGDVFVSAERWSTEGFQENSAADGTTATGRVGWTWRDGSRLETQLAHVNTGAGLPGGTPVPLGQWDGRRERQAADLTSRVDQKRNEGRLRLALALGRAGVLETHLSAAALEYISEGQTADTDKMSWGAETVWRPGGRTLAGLSYAWDHLHARVTGGFPSQAIAHDADWGAFAQTSAGLGPVTVTPALRFDQHSVFGNVYNPRFTVVTRLTDSVSLSANAARSFRAPTLVNLFQDFGFFKNNPDLKPETAWSYDAGVRAATAEGKGAAGLTGHYARIRDRIADVDLDADGFGDVNVNAPRAELSGLEAELERRAGPFLLSGSYTYQRAVGSTTAKSRYKSLAFTPRHLAGAALKWTGPRGWALSQDVRYSHRRFSGAGDSGVKLPSFTLWDARLTKRILMAELTLAVDNVTDKHYAESRSFGGLVPQPGRTFWGGATVSFGD